MRVSNARHFLQRFLNYDRTNRTGHILYIEILQGDSESQPAANGSSDRRNANRKDIFGSSRRMQERPPLRSFATSGPRTESHNDFRAGGTKGHY